MSSGSRMNSQYPYSKDNEQPSLNSFVFVFTLVYSVLSSLVVVIRAVGFHGIVHILKVINPLLTFVSFISIISRRKLRVPNGFAFLLLLMVVQGLSVGFISGIEIRALASHLFVGVFAFIIYYDFYCSDYSEERLEKYLKTFVYYTFYINLLGITVYLAGFYTGFIHYLGYSCEAVLVCVAYFMVKRRHLYVLMSILIIIASAKRGVYLGLIVVIIVYYLPLISKQFIVNIVIGAVLSIAILAFVMAVANFIGETDIPVVSGIINKFNQLNVLRENFSWAKASSGRTLELAAVWERFNSSSFYLFTGMGYGWSFEWTALSGQYSLKQHYVHLSYFNILLQYGLFVFILYMYFMVRLLAQYYTCIMFSRKTRSVYYVFFMYFCGKAVVGFTGYSMSIDLLYWVLFGIIGAEVKKCEEFIADNMYRG